jgi:cell division septal protein FtsQ
MAQYTTANLARRKKIRMYWKIGLTIGFVAVLFYGISFWSKQESIQIQTINITGNKYVETETILEGFNNVVSEKLFYIFDKNNIAFLPRTKIVNEIKKELPVRAVYIKMSGLKTVNIEVVEYEPAAIWCADFTEKNCYFLNSNGLFFVKASEIVLNDLIKISAELDGEVLGTNYVDEKIFNNFVKLQSLFKKINIIVSQISTKDYETFTLLTKNGPKILVDKKDDPIEVANNLKTTIEQESIHEIQLQNIEYIDLRFSGKAYYKIK